MKSTSAQFRLFGPPSLVVNDAEVRIPRRKATALLANLSLAAGPTDPETLLPAPLAGPDASQGARCAPHNDCGAARRTARWHPRRVGRDARRDVRVPFVRGCPPVLERDRAHRAPAPAGRRGACR